MSREEAIFAYGLPSFKLCVNLLFRALTPRLYLHPCEELKT